MDEPPYKGYDIVLATNGFYEVFDVWVCLCSNFKTVQDAEKYIDKIKEKENADKK